MFWVVPSPIIRTANNCIYNTWLVSHHYCYLPPSWKSWNWFECAVGGVVLSGNDLCISYTFPVRELVTSIDHVDCTL
jgi:hypothetical protein